MKLFPCLLLSLSLLASWVQASDLQIARVVIDAGHGGKDDGTRRYGVKEKELTLDTAKRLERVLRLNGMKTVMTRRDDQFVPLQERAKMANQYTDAVFLSIHFNSINVSSVKGIETYYATRQGRELAQGIQHFVCQRLRTQSRGVLYHPAYAVLNKSRNPSVIVECGYLSNPWERRRCGGAWYRQMLAEQIAKAILIHRA